MNMAESKTMATLQTADKNQLILVRKAALYLRDKLLEVDRDGPLIKLINREVTIIDEELNRRKALAMQQTQEIAKLNAQSKSTNNTR